MKLKLIFLLALVLLALIIVLQNTEIVPVRLLLWTVSMSRIILILFFLLLGLVLGLLIAAVMIKRVDPKTSKADIDMDKNSKTHLNY